MELDWRLDEGDFWWELIEDEDLVRAENKGERERDRIKKRELERKRERNREYNRVNR